jgi:hypothetical protein
MSGADRKYTVRVSVDGQDPTELPFDWNFDPGSPMRAYVAKIDGGTCVMPEIRELGSRLWNTLCPANLNLRGGARFTHSTVEDPLAIRIEIPTEREIEQLPWEALHDATFGCLLGSDERYTFARLPASDASPPEPRPKDRTTIRVLVVVPQGSQLRTRYETQNLRDLAGSLPERQLEVTVLDGRVTLGQMQETLSRGYWDVLHYIGHGEVGDDAGITIRFNDEKGESDFVDSFRFAQVLIDHAIQLAVLSCCMGASPSISPSLTGLGPDLTRISQIPAVIAMRHGIADNDATTFSRRLYAELFSGKHAGRIDIAVQAARKDLLVNGRGESTRAFMTPVVYLAPGCERLFELAAQSPRSDARSVPSPISVVDGPQVDGELLASLRKRRCIPIVGPGIFAPTARSQGQEQPRDLLTIARTLAAESKYPDRYEIELAEQGGEGFAHLLLGRVCQYYEDSGKRYRLVERLEELCRAPKTLPPMLVAVASWEVPGFFYTHFDGLLEKAVRESQRRHSPSVLNVLNAPRAATTAVPLIVNVRGTLALGDSLVLTEFDHDERYERLDRMSEEIVDLFNQNARAVLFVGVSPRDPAVRRLCRELLKKGVKHTQGPRYFLGAETSAVDRAYWEPFDVKWIDRPLHEVLDVLTAAATEDST